MRRRMSCRQQQVGPDGGPGPRLDSKQFEARGGLVMRAIGRHLAVNLRTRTRGGHVSVRVR